MKDWFRKRELQRNELQCGKVTIRNYADDLPVHSRCEKDANAWCQIAEKIQLFFSLIDGCLKYNGLDQRPGTTDSGLDWSVAFVHIRIKIYDKWNIELTEWD